MALLPGDLALPQEAHPLRGKAGDLLGRAQDLRKHVEHLDVRHRLPRGPTERLPARRRLEGAPSPVVLEALDAHHGPEPPMNLVSWVPCLPQKEHILFAGLKSIAVPPTLRRLPRTVVPSGVRAPDPATTTTSTAQRRRFFRGTSSHAASKSRRADSARASSSAWSRPNVNPFSPLRYALHAVLTQDLTRHHGVLVSPECPLHLLDRGGQSLGPLPEDRHGRLRRVAQPLRLLARLVERHVALVPAVGVSDRRDRTTEPFAVPFQQARRASRRPPHPPRR